MVDDEKARGDRAGGGIRTDQTPMYLSRFKALVERGLLQDEYDTAEALVDAFLAADRAVRDAAKVPLLGRTLRDRMRQDLLDRIAVAKAHRPPQSAPEDGSGHGGGVGLGVAPTPASVADT